jgi:hypothetical protein
LILSLSIAGIALASGLAIAFATERDRPEMVRLVFASVLPLFGTWVGTVLAFYFARENLQAATDSTIRLAGRLEPATPVAEVMIPKAQMHGYSVPAQADAGTIKFIDIQRTMEQSNVRRMPILRGDTVQYVVHDSTIAKFADSVGKKPSDLTTETMNDLLAKPEFRSQVEAIGYVGPDADLAQARAAMRSVKGCNDVFVTKQGQPTDPVIGWLTNTQLAGLE